MPHGICVLHKAILALIIPRFYIRNLHFNTNKSSAIFASNPQVTQGMFKGVEETASDYRGKSHFPDGNHPSQTWLWVLAGPRPTQPAASPPLQALSSRTRNLSVDGEGLRDVSQEQICFSPFPDDPWREGAPEHLSPLGCDLPAHKD